MTEARHRARRRLLVSRAPLAVLGAVLLIAAALLLLPLTSPGVGTSAEAAATSVSTTVQGTGDFASLKVTVAKTKGLINEVVPITWTGGTPTVPGGTRFDTDYLQIMQCWGDDAGGPDRTQCEFGGLASVDGRGGNYTNLRQVNYGDGLIDPAESLHQTAPGQTVFVPFHAVSGEKLTGNSNQFFDQYTTNEIDYAQTGADGTGQAYFEMQTARESAGLGCGATTPSGPRKCWLVIVPRGEKEVNSTPTTRLQSSALSQTNWDHRLQVPLTFSPVEQACPIGSAERRTAGTEAFAEAIGRWQPALCNGAAKTVYGYSVAPDSVAIRQLTSTDPQMEFLTAPVPPTQVSAERPLVYAPVALSSLNLGFLIEQTSSKDAPDSVKRLDGQRLKQLNLTPRLVAKLLTQSYRSAVVDSEVGYLAHNPRDMFHDPDFLAINPEFANYSFSRGIADIVVPLGLSDLNRQLWAYVASDEEAVNFIQGQPDRWGMSVNPAYQKLTIPTQEFPKADPLCQTFNNGQLPLCTQDAHAYAADLHDAARSVSRGDPLARNSWDGLAVPPQYKKTPPLAPGTRSLIAFADSATASRYSLVGARLRNAAGQFVAPTSASILAGYQAMSASGVRGVKVGNPQASAASAYPLVNVTYAVTAPNGLTAPQARDYASLIRYAVGAGQIPGPGIGQLPDGYVPLPAAERAQALASASVVAAGPQPTSTPTPTPTTTTPTDSGSTDTGATDTGSTDSGSTDTSSTDTGSAGTGSTDTGGSTEPVAAPAPSKSPAVTPLVPDPGSTAPSTTPVAAAAVTPDTPVGSNRLAIVAALILGGAAALAGSLLPWFRGGGV